MKGFTLEEIHEALGETTVSRLEPDALFDLVSLIYLHFEAMLI